MSDKTTTDSFVALMEATFDVAPPAPELPTARDRGTAPRRPAVAVAAGFGTVLLVVGGVLAVLMLGPGKEPTWRAPSDQQQVVGIDEYWDWATSDATELGADMVEITRLGPVPTFDPAGYGEFQQLVSRVSVADDASLTDLDVEAKPPIAYVGSTQTDRIDIYMFRTDRVPGGQLVLCLDNAEGTACTGTDDSDRQPVDDENPVWWLSSRPAPGDSQPSSEFAVAMLPEDASLVVIELSDGRAFSQRPTGGVAVFEIPGEEPMSVSLIVVLDSHATPLSHHRLSM